MPFASHDIDDASWLSNSIRIWTYLVMRVALSSGILWDDFESVQDEV